MHSTFFNNTCFINCRCCYFRFFNCRLLNYRFLNYRLLYDWFVNRWLWYFRNFRNCWYYWAAGTTGAVGTTGFGVSAAVLTSSSVVSEGATGVTTGLGSTVGSVTGTSGASTGTISPAVVTSGVTTGGTVVLAVVAPISGSTGGGVVISPTASTDGENSDNVNIIDSIKLDAFFIFLIPPYLILVFISRTKLILYLLFLMPNASITLICANKNNNKKRYPEVSLMYFYILR
jgi:hypothetical protein